MNPVNTVRTAELRLRLDSPGRVRVDGPAFRRLSVLMPVYNERWTLREIVGRVLAAPVPLEIELVAVDDGSTDGSWEMLAEMAAADGRIRAVRHARNRGKGAAIRTAIERMQGDIAVIQDADLEYEPAEFCRLLRPILDGRADAVFGSRYAGESRRVLPFWHTLVNKSLTLLSNVLNDLSLTDMETCYKMIRADVLRQLRLQSDTFTLEPELTCRLAQWGARIFEAPVSYNARSYQDGKKIRPVDGLKALGAMLRCRFLSPQFARPGRRAELAAESAGRRRWVLREAERYLGPRVLHVGAGLGDLSRMLLDRPRVILAESDLLCIETLRRRFGHRINVCIEPHAAGAGGPRLQNEEVDAAICAEGSGAPLDAGRLGTVRERLAAGGHCIVVTCGARMAQVQNQMIAAGFEIAGVHRRGLLRRTAQTCLVVGKKPAPPAHSKAA